MPLSVFWVMLLAAIFLYIRNRRIWSKRVLLLAFIWFIIISTPFVPNLLVRNLEKEYPVVSLENIKSAGSGVNILVLGAGHTADERLPATAQLSLAELGRLVEGIRIHRQIPGSRLITSANEGSQETPQAVVAANAALLLGVKESAVEMQCKPYNTKSEAQEYKRLFGDTAQLVLVTSAIHMPRAMYLFQRAGLNPVAAPTNFAVKQGGKKGIGNWVPSSENIRKMERAIHEYAGLLWEKVRDKGTGGG